MIIDSNHPGYKKIMERHHGIYHNGAYYYSLEIRKHIIPQVRTKRNWVLLNIPGVAYNDSIIFIHNNLNPQNYNWLRRYSNLILVCGIEETMEKVAHLGTPIYLPLSIDVEEVEQYICTKTKRTAFVGRSSKKNNAYFAPGTDFIEDLPREKLLPLMAQYKNVYAVGRTAIEARVLGCDILAYDSRFPNPARWKILDSRDAAHILQKELDKVDSR